MDDNNKKTAMAVSINTIIANTVLSAFKLFAGTVGASSALIADAVHSMSDVISTIVVIIGVKMSGAQSDKEHQYGHERMESAAAVILSFILVATGISIGVNGVKKIMYADYISIEMPGVLPLIAAVISIAVKEGMYQYTKAAAKKVNSDALMADAWHHRSDALSSIGSFAGILGARFGYPIFDPIACLVICLFILKAGADIFLDAIGKMTDKACDDTVVDEIRQIISSNKDVICIDELKTRVFGDKIYVDLEICVDGGATLREAHAVAQKVHDSLESNMPKIKHCMVHINPYE